MSISYGGDYITDTDGGKLKPSSSVMRNRIINGAMVLDQRNAGSSITPTNGQYCVDRWQNAVNVSSKYSCQQVADAPAGFSYSLKATSLSSYTIGSGELASFRQYIEGYNTADLAQGTANAKSFTLSFWVKSSLTGTFGGVVSNDSDRTWAFTYTISAANTWEQKTVTITGQTGGTWNTTTGVGLSVIFSLACGSTYLATPAQWNSSNSYGATGQGSILATNGATWQMTGVQLESGSSATGFEYRQYGQELNLCYRYFWKWTIGPSSDVSWLAFGWGASWGTNTATMVMFPVTLRTAASVSLSSASTYYRHAPGIVQEVASTINCYYADKESMNLFATGSTSLSNGVGTQITSAANQTATISVSAEL